MRRLPLHILPAILIGCLELIIGACGGTANVADCESAKKIKPCSQRTKVEDAENDLNAGDYDDAITLLTESISDDPTDYTQYPLLSAAYAARAGLDILNIASANFSGSGGLVDALTSFIPGPAQTGAAAYPTHVADMKSAVDVLHEIPAANLADTSGDKYAASAVLQLTLYQSAYAIMFLNQFAISATTGQIDLKQLSTMSESDAETVIENLAAAGQIPGVSNNAALQTQVQSALSQINSEPGTTQKDKLDAFIASQHGVGTSTDLSTDTSVGTGTSTGTGTGG
jgi:hypothetical protein